MNRTLAHVAAIGVLVFCLGSLVVYAASTFAFHDRIQPGTIVIVGDPEAPGMRDVIEELRGDARRGDPLRSNLEPNGGLLIVPLIVLLWVGVGVMIVWRQPGNWAGWLFIITGGTLPVSALASAIAVYNLKAGGSIPLTGLFIWIGEYALYPVALIPLLFLLYPDGHPPSPRWRWAVRGIVGGTALAFLGFVVRPGPFNNWRGDGIVYRNPFGIDAFTWADDLIALGTIIALISSLSTVVAVRQRFRRSTGEERQQMRVLAFVAAIVAVSFGGLLVMIAIGSAFGLQGEEDSLDWAFGLFLIVTAITVLVGTPVAYLVAIFRYRLWDLDLVIKKAVVALVLTLLMVVVGVAGLAVFGQFALWESANPRVSVLAGVVFGLLFLPLLRLARKIATRLTFGKRATPYEVLTAFGERVGETYSTDDVLPRMAHLLADGTGASSARVLLRIGPELREEARWPAEPEQPGDEHVVPVVDRGEELGALAVSMPASDPMNPAKEKLVQDLAAQAGLLLRNVRLIEELRASRQRLVAAQDEERRRIERNIHDGAQQQLVALSVKLRLAQGLVIKDAGKAEAMLGELQRESQSALEDLRDLARGIYPPLLADKGLAAALEAQARKSTIPVDVQSDGVERYPQDVESAIYFCTLEAMNNVTKYAEATNATVRLAQHDGQLIFTVSDDGRGFDPEATGYGTGLQGMADRLDAVGGTLDVASAPGSGTRVSGRVPVEGSSS